VTDKTEWGIFICIYNIIYIFVFIYIYIWRRRKRKLLTVYNAVLLLFYHETPEWPTRLNEAYLYIHTTLCIHIRIHIYVYIFMFIFIWHRRKGTILIVCNASVLLFYYEKPECPTQLNEVYIYVYTYHIIYVYLYIHIYMTPYKRHNTDSI